ncbi:MAG: hypothetical protein LBU32_00875 [Clostridiales bacterium]|jgi:hypothetical protein|nr:hypothetical protein [Clostridiales bacterium]
MDNMLKRRCNYEWQGRSEGKAACFVKSIGFNMSNSLLKNLASMPAAAARGFRGKMAGFAFEGARHRTAYSRSMRGFSKGGSFSGALKSFALEAIKKKRGETGEPICIIIDNATSALSKGAQKAKRQDAGRRCSRLGGTTAFGQHSGLNLIAVLIKILHHCSSACLGSAGCLIFSFCFLGEVLGGVSISALSSIIPAHWQGRIFHRLS